jgi:hypothetical protein
VSSCLIAEGDGQFLQPLLLSLPGVFDYSVSLCIWDGRRGTRGCLGRLGVCKLLCIPHCRSFVCSALWLIMVAIAFGRFNYSVCRHNWQGLVEFDVVSAVDAEGDGQLLQPLLLSLPTRWV